MVAIIIDLDSSWSNKLYHFLYFAIFLTLFHYNISFKFYYSPDIEVNFNCVRYR